MTPPLDELLGVGLEPPTEVAVGNALTEAGVVCTALEAAN
jgi:hypothetical protein